MPRSDSKEGRVAENSEFGNQRWVWRYRERISPQTAAVLVRFRRHLRRQPETAPLCTVRRGNAINGMRLKIDTSRGSRGKEQSVRLRFNTNSRSTERTEGFSDSDDQVVLQLHKEMQGERV
eukprot:3015946-Rhodomonas_salina.1